MIVWLASRLYCFHSYIGTVVQCEYYLFIVQIEFLINELKSMQSIQCMEH